MNKVVGLRSLDVLNKRLKFCTFSNTESLWILKKLNKILTDKKIAYIIVVTLNIFNITDLITTYLGLSSGRFFEENLVVAHLFKISPALMMLFKLSVVVAFSILVIKINISNASKALTKGVYFGLILGTAISSIFMAVTSFHNLLLLVTV